MCLERGSKEQEAEMERQSQMLVVNIGMHHLITS